MRQPILTKRGKTLFKTIACLVIACIAAWHFWGVGELLKEREIKEELRPYDYEKLVAQQLQSEWECLPNNFKEREEFILKVIKRFRPNDYAQIQRGREWVNNYRIKVSNRTLSVEERKIAYASLNDVLLTQKLIVQPYAEFNFSAQDIHDQDIGAGIVDGKVGLQTRYEFTRKFAPYVDVHYGTKFGETASIAKSNSEDKDELVGAVGLRLMF